jgi:hypothetical protein
MKSSLSLIYRVVRFMVLEDPIAYMEDLLVEKGNLNF